MTTVDHPNREFTLTWTLDAPPSDVFRAWTDPDHLGWFYNPEQPLPTDPIEVDLRVGGVWRQRMAIDEDTDYVTGGVYDEIVPDERLVFYWGATDGWPKLDLERPDESPRVSVTIERVEGQTALTVHVELPAELPADGLPGWWAYAKDGWTDTVDRLAAALATTAV